MILTVVFDDCAHRTQQNNQTCDNDTEEHLRPYTPFKQHTHLEQRMQFPTVTRDIQNTINVLMRETIFRICDAPLATALRMHRATNTHTHTLRTL